MASAYYGCRALIDKSPILGRYCDFLRPIATISEVPVREAGKSDNGLLFASRTRHVDPS
jgi:hypothetical protein